MYQKILVPYDGSKFSKKALGEAVKIARASGGVIYLCMIVNVGSIVPPGSLLGFVKSATAGDLHRRLLKSAGAEAEKTLSAQTKYCKANNIRAYYKIIIDGNAAEEILKVARRSSIDLIVIGSQGLHGIGKVKTLGSVSRRVSELAGCPVLIVR